MTTAYDPTIRRPRVLSSPFDHVLTYDEMMRRIGIKAYRHACYDMYRTRLGRFCARVTGPEAGIAAVQAQLRAERAR